LHIVLVFAFTLALGGFKQATIATAAQIDLAASTATPETKSEPFDVDSLQVISVHPIDLVGGPANKDALLAPDGERFAYLDGPSICVYAIDGAQRSCTAVQDRIDALDPQSIRWSPDSRYLVMTENFFVMFVDSDIWVLDTESGTLSNLTEDSIDRIDVTADDWADIDVIPHWLGDQIVFLRYSRKDGETASPEIMTIAPDGTNLTVNGEITTDEVFPVSAMDVAPDSSALALTFNPRKNEASAGTWIFDLDEFRLGQFFQTDHLLVPVAVTYSPDARYVLTFDARRELPPESGEPEDSGVRLLELESSERLLLDAEHIVSSAGWSPDGSALAYLVLDRSHPEISGLYLSSAPGDSGRMVLQGLFIQPTGLGRQSIGWGANNVILLSDTEDGFKLRAIQLGEQ
jgi:hypothetical protein